MIFHLVLIAVPLALLALFLALVGHEERTGRRLALAGPRYHFDQKMERVLFIVRHVDWGAFFNDLTRSGAERALHDMAHATLIFVRALERELTGIVRRLRARRDPTALLQAEEATPLSAAAAYLRKTVRRSRKVPALPPHEDRAA